MKKLLLICFVLGLAAVAQSPVQNFFSTADGIYDPPYGMVAQLWNPGPDTITVDYWQAMGAPDGVEHVIDWGMGISDVEQVGCTAQAIHLRDDSRSSLAPMTTVRVSKQPCVIGGVPYNSGNYTPTNFANFKQCWGNVCKADGPLVLPPGRGATVYVAQFVTPTDYVHGFPGWVAVNFYWHK